MLLFVSNYSKYGSFTVRSSAVCAISPFWLIVVELSDIEHGQTASSRVHCCRVFLMMLDKKFLCGMVF